MLNSKTDYEKSSQDKGASHGDSSNNFPVQTPQSKADVAIRTFRVRPEFEYAWSKLCNLPARHVKDVYDMFPVDATGWHELNSSSSASRL